MRVFVDFVRATGLYEAALETSWLDSDTPTQVLTAPAFLKAHGMSMVAQRRRVYHVERRRFIDETFGGVGDLDTLIVVNSDEAMFDDARAIEALWHVTGGAARRIDVAPQRRRMAS